MSGGRARALWFASRVVRLAGYGAVVVLLDVVAHATARPGASLLSTEVLVVGAVVLVLLYAERRVRWHAETHVPGAFRVYVDPRGLPPQRSLRELLPDLGMTVVDIAVLAGGGVFVAHAHGPGIDANAAGVVGTVGGAVLAGVLWNVAVNAVARAHAPARDRLAPLVFATVRVVPAAVWAVAGTTAWAVGTFVPIAALLLLGSVAGLAIRRIVRPRAH